MPKQPSSDGTHCARCLAGEHRRHNGCCLTKSQKRTTRAQSVQRSLHPEGSPRPISDTHNPRQGQRRFYFRSRSKISRPTWRRKYGRRSTNRHPVEGAGARCQRRPVHLMAPPRSRPGVPQSSADYIEPYPASTAVRSQLATRAWTWKSVGALL
jgi:hypothetical protein